MANAIARGRVQVKGKKVLELGAGAGIPGLIAKREGAELVSLFSLLLVLVMPTEPS